VIKQELINALKAFRFSTMGKEHVAKVFPELLANSCRSMAITDILGAKKEVIYDWGKLVEYKINFSNAIYSDAYDMLDNIVIEFYKSYNYKIIVPPGRLVLFHVDFPDEAIEKFTNICNAFKGQLWDDILDNFLDSFYEFVSTATVHGDAFESWH
jgi:hypothetical protein